MRFGSAVTIISAQCAIFISHPIVSNIVVPNIAVQGGYIEVLGSKTLKVLTRLVAKSPILYAFKTSIMSGGGDQKVKASEAAKLVDILDGCAVEISSC